MAGQTTNNRESMVGHLRCPKCGSKNTRVYDSRPSEGTIRRFRECKFGHRFATVEEVEGMI